MTTIEHANQPVATRAGRRRRTALAVSAAINAFSAWAGAVGLATGAIALADGLNQRLPFDSPVVGGLALAAIVALPFTVLAWQAWTADPRSGRTAVAAGVLLVGWIGVQVAFLQELSWFHPAYALIGIGFIAAGWRTPTSEPPDA